MRHFIVAENLRVAEDFQLHTLKWTRINSMTFKLPNGDTVDYTNNLAGMTALPKGTQIYEGPYYQKNKAADDIIRHAEQHTNFERKNEGALVWWEKIA